MSPIEKLRNWDGVPGMSIVSNSVLTTLKLIIGIYTGSVSVVAEAIHSGMDLIAAVMAFFSFRFGRKPPDQSHTFGHGKIENLSGSVEALLIFVAAGLIIYESVRRIMYGSDLQALESGLAVMGFSAIVNLGVGYYTWRFSKIHDSIAMEVNAWHLFTDVFTCLGVFVGLAVVHLTDWTIVDPIVAIAVALYICSAAYKLTTKSVRDLLDTSLPQHERQKIAQVLERHGGHFIEYHELRSRKAGAHRHVDLHLVVDGSMSVEAAHQLCDHLEVQIRSILSRTHLVIHCEPPDHRQMGSSSS